MALKPARRVAPRELSKSSRRLWHQIVNEWILEPHHEETLKQALLCLDRAEEARQILDRDGLMVRDRFDQLKEHPAASVERMNRLAYSRLLREIGLDHVEPDTPRPPRIGGQS